nr:MAG TPA: leucine-rich repeat protein [Caudoviricetes sp.]
MATPISIEIKKSSNTCYFVGETSNVKVRSINVTYDDGTVKALTSGYTVSQVDTSEAGEKISIVEYSGLTVELAVTVVDSYNVQAGTPNLEDVNITFDLETGLLKVTGTGEFLSLSNIENTPSSIKTRIKKVNIGNGITKIPVNAFGGNENLEDISFPNTLEEICDGNFYSTKITQIVFPQSLKKIGQSCFSSSALISLEIPDSVLEIGSSSFSNLSSLKKVIFHEGLETISPVAFNECPLITELDLPSTLKNMQYNFQGSSLESLEMGGEGTIFSSSGNERISNISAKSMTIRGGTIDNGAFYYNNTVENLSLGETVKWNGSGQFSGCSKLTNVSISNGITSIPEGCFRECSSIDNVILPDSVTELGESAFSGCTSLKNITLSKNLKAIPSYCFSKCAFESFLIPDDSTIETLGDALFQNCGNLTSVYIGNNVKTIGSGCFYGANSLATIRINQKENAISGAPWAASNATVEWGNAIVTGIEITTLPTKISYKKGDVFDDSGLIVKATYDDGTTKEITGYTLSSPDMTSAGEKTITVTYQEKTATFAITVYDIVSIKVKEYFGNISSFFIGDENTGQYRYAAKSLTAIYGNGEEETIPYGKFTETPVDTSKEGTYYTTVSYDGKETRNPYTVYGSPFTIATGYPDKESATATLDLSTGICAITGTGQIGTPFNSPRSFGKKVKELKINEGITGIHRFEFCSNITLLEIPSTVEELSEGSLPIDGITGILGSGGFSTATIKINAKKDSIVGSPWGQTSATIIWTAKPEKLNIVSLPTKLEYEVGDELDPTGIECNALYSNGKTYVIDGELSYEADMSEAGEKTVTVSYTEDEKTITASFSIEILAKTAGIRIAKYPDKKYYKIGESLDISGLEVVKYREDGTESEITDYTVSELNSSESGPKSITVTYTEGTSTRAKVSTYDAEFQARVTSDGTDPFIDNEDDEDSDEDEKKKQINITIHWINGEFADLTNENIDQNTLTLQESICSEQYFIFGGCVCNQITFQAHHDQFNGTSEEFYPSGKIEVYIERKGTKIKIFTGEIDSAERKANSLTRNFIAYDYLYKLRNTDIARWYKNQTTDKNKLLTQKQFRDKLFKFLGIEQVETKLHWDDTYVPNTNNSNEMNVVNILKDLCLQNDRFGWMNRDGKFEYLKLRQNSYRYGQTTGNQNIYKYYNNEEVHLDTFKSFTAKEGRIWFPNVIFCEPDPNRAFGFTQGDYTAQEAYDNNVYYNRNSFFVGNEDWLNYVWDADEYGGISRAKPIMKICYGVFVNQDLRKYYRAQGYTAEVQGNPLNMVGQAVELYYKKQIQHDEQEPAELQWYVHSYIMSRTLKLGNNQLIDTYSANNAPFNSNSQQLGKYTPEISGTVNLTRSEMPTISYAEFTDGSDSEFSPATIDDFTDGSGGSGSTSEQLKKAQLRCVKRIKKADYDALVAAGTDRTDTLYFTFEEE